MAIINHNHWHLAQLIWCNFYRSTRCGIWWECILWKFAWLINFPHFDPCFEQRAIAKWVDKQNQLGLDIGSALLLRGHSYDIATHGWPPSCKYPSMQESTNQIWNQCKTVKDWVNAKKVENMSLCEFFHLFCPNVIRFKRSGLTCCALATE